MDISANIVNGVVCGFEFKGIDLSKILEEVNIPREFLSNPDNRVSISQYELFWELLVKKLNDETLGLKICENFNISVLGVLGFILQSCKSLNEAAEKAQEYKLLMGRTMDLKVHKRENFSKIEFMPSLLIKKPVVLKQLLQYEILATLKIIQILAGKQIGPSLVKMSISEPAEKAFYEDMLGCKVLFNCLENSIEFNENIWGYRVVTNNPELLFTLDNLAKEMLERISGESNFITEVKSQVVKNIKFGFPEIENIAQNLNITVRTLQRRLQNENITFFDLTENIKKELAYSYLKNKSLSISEISYFLGYSDPSSFIRIFKKWTGLTPESYRKNVS